MKGLLKYLSPFAPDQSGAAAVFYDMDCITVICDAGGCTGNVCGFDEPRWFMKKRPIFSAGLRDMDAILGRDEKMIEKIQKAAQKLDGQFVAIIGTPVPAVIATDFKALKRMAEKKCKVPVVTCDCTGTRLYDAGEEQAYLELVKTFAEEKARFCAEVSDEKSSGENSTGENNSGEERKIIGIFGVTPLELSSLSAEKQLEAYYKSQGYTDVFCYGMGAGLEAIRLAGQAKKNIAVSPAGKKACEYLKEKFGTPYEMACPILPEALLKELEAVEEKKVLILHQQVIAKEIKQILAEKGCAVTCATFFMMDPTLTGDGDIHLETEADLQKLVNEGNFDLIIGDPLFARAVSRETYGKWIDCPHFAVSGKLID